MDSLLHRRQLVRNTLRGFVRLSLSDVDIVAVEMKKRVGVHVITDVAKLPSCFEWAEIAKNEFENQYGHICELKPNPEVLRAGHLVAGTQEPVVQIPKSGETK